MPHTYSHTIHTHCYTDPEEASRLTEEVEAALLEGDRVTLRQFNVRRGAETRVGLAASTRAAHMFATVCADAPAGRKQKTTLHDAHPHSRTHRRPSTRAARCAPWSWWGSCTTRAAYRVRGQTRCMILACLWPSLRASCGVFCSCTAFCSCAVPHHAFSPPPLAHACTHCMTLQERCSCQTQSARSRWRSASALSWRSAWPGRRRRRRRQRRRSRRRWVQFVSLCGGGGVGQHSGK